MQQLVFATNNKHKLDEVRAILGTLSADEGSQGFEILSLADIECHDDIPEDAATLEGNALQKARYIKERYGYDCFADDTGLEVAALNGAPGIYSARYAAIHDSTASSHDSEANMRLLLDNLKNKSDRSARFRTAIALIYRGETHLFEGIVNGSIATERHGDEGFGYDPIFRPDEAADGRTFAEMSGSEKNALSHRGRAVAKLASFLQQTL